MRIALQATLLLVAASAAWAAALAPSTSAPGGLTPAQTPQFVLISHDDAIKENTAQMMHSLLDGVTTNNCVAAATMFVTRPNTANNCELTMELYSMGYEIADHTLSHQAQGPLSKEQITEQIMGFFPAIEKCGVPRSDVVGFRAPFLETKPEQRRVLAENGFLYDSTLVENTKGRSMSADEAHRVWPWTMDAGTMIDCDKFQRRQVCEDNERYPGLWQIPIWQQTALGGPYNLDVGEDMPGQVYDILKANFDASYGGNRAPYAIPFHSPFLSSGDNLQQMKKFVDYAASQPDVYFITYRQLVAWMQNPLPVGQLTAQALGCGNKGGAPGTLLASSSSSGGGSSALAAPAPAPAAEDSGAAAAAAAPASASTAAGKGPAAMAPMVAEAAAAPAPASTAAGEDSAARAPAAAEAPSPAKLPAEAPEAAAPPTTSAAPAPAPAPAQAPLEAQAVAQEQPAAPQQPPAGGKYASLSEALAAAGYQI